MSPRALKIGVMMEEVQFSDIMGAGWAESKFLDTAPEMEFFYMADTLDPANMGLTMKIVPNVTYDGAPRDLDILVIGGPLITHRPAAADKFMKEAFPQTKAILTTCIGSIWLASSGVMKGMKATTNRGFLPIARQLYPDVEWQDQRWIVDGKLWTSGGAQAGKKIKIVTGSVDELTHSAQGIDMVATYVLEHFDREMAQFLGLNLLDVDPTARGQFYK
ncbi:hypothetical protein MBLNU459_g7758t2 [Dothideomycetes sp. NU459]